MATAAVFREPPPKIAFARERAHFCDDGVDASTSQSEDLQRTVELVASLIDSVLLLRKISQDGEGSTEAGLAQAHPVFLC